MKEKIKDQFVPYEIALAIKELGFNEECLGYYFVHIKDAPVELIIEINTRTNANFIKAGAKRCCLAPLWQQCIDWFREKYDIDIEIHSKFGHGNGWWANLCYNPTRTEVLNIAIFDNYYEAREQAILECIKLLKKV